MASKLENQGETEQNECIYKHHVDQLSLTSRFLITCLLKQEKFQTKLRPLMGEQVGRTIGEINLQSLLLIKYVLDPILVLGK